MGQRARFRTDEGSFQDQSTVATEPTFGATEPTFGATEPTFGATEPTFGATEPTFGATEPTFGATEPTFGATEPASRASVAVQASVPSPATERVLERQPGVESVQHLENNGYNVEYVDGFTDGTGTVFWNFVLRRGGPERMYRLYPSTQSVSEDRVALKEYGWHPVNIQSYRQPYGIGYAVVYSKQSPAYHFQLAASGSEHQNMFYEMRDRGFSPVAVSVVSRDGKRRYTTLYQRRRVGEFSMDPAIPADEMQVEFDKNRWAGRELFYRKAYRHKGDLHYAAIFHSEPRWFGIDQPISRIRSRRGLNWWSYLSKKKELTVEDSYVTRGLTSYVVKDGDSLNDFRFDAFWVKY